MRVNNDFDAPVGLDIAEQDWIASPMPGVDRKMLDRIGDEVARATSVVRYAPASHFSAHTHSGGEEFIVLEGTFQDEHGDYPAGTYVRNPIGTRHIPRSDDGCTIFVKLWQFDESDQDQFAHDLAKVELTERPDVPGVFYAKIFSNEQETVVLEKWACNSERHLSHPGGAELLVLEGDLEWDGKRWPKHSWIRLPRNYSARFNAGAKGTRCWIKTGHLAHIKLPQT